MEELNRGDKIYLDRDNTIESEVNRYLSCRDGIVQVMEYRDSSGYGTSTRLFYCQNTKHESEAIIRQTFGDIDGDWEEEIMSFDSDSFEYLVALLKNQGPRFKEYTCVRDYNGRF